MLAGQVLSAAFLAIAYIYIFFFFVKTVQSIYKNITIAKKAIERKN
jgi:uncharacterized protein YoxC